LCCYFEKYWFWSICISCVGTSHIRQVQVPISQSDWCDEWQVDRWGIDKWQVALNPVSQNLFTRLVAIHLLNDQCDKSGSGSKDR
jgi:hypothetical protein